MQPCDDAGVDLPIELVESDLRTPYGVALRYGTKAPATIDRPAALNFAAAAVEWAGRLVTA